MEFRVLGLLEVAEQGRPVTIGPGKESALLALLLVNANQPLSIDRLCEELWEERQPENAAKTVQIYVSRLRGRLDRERIVTTRAGYMLKVEDSELDVSRFERLAAEGHSRLEAGEARLAEAVLTEALDLWCGHALADFRFEAFAQMEIGRLQELHGSAAADRIDARLALGKAEELIPELESMVREQPLWERPRKQLMLALYQSGRQPDALALYQSTRALLTEQLGLDPSPELQALERSILNQAPELDRPRPQLAARLGPLEAVEQPAQAEAPNPAAQQTISPLPRMRLPAATNRLVGREGEAQALREMLVGQARLVTVTGAGGSGKTRLALEVATSLEPEFPGGAHYVALGPLRQPELLPATILTALGLDEASGEPPLATLRRVLQGEASLLVLDNFEQLLPAAPLLAELLVACPRLKLLVTSRASLHLSGEHEYPLDPLPLEPAVALFTERARSVRPSFSGDESLLTAICARLDCLPLAIELAACHSRLFSADELLRQLERRLEVLTGGASDLDSRQQTLRATIEWSHELLDPEERQLFALLAVFSGGCTVEAAARVFGASPAQLESLVDKNLLRWREEAGEGRFSMLETIREYALEQLDAEGGVEGACRSYADYYLALARERIAEHDQGRVAALDDLEQELDNFLAAFGWSHGPDPVPVPIDDGGCDHLAGLAIPTLALTSTQGALDLEQLARGLLVLYIYPGTTRLGRVPLPGLYEIAGGQGCTRESRPSVTTPPSWRHSAPRSPASALRHSRSSSSSPTALRCRSRSSPTRDASSAPFSTCRHSTSADRLSTNASRSSSGKGSSSRSSTRSSRPTGTPRKWRRGSQQPKARARRPERSSSSLSRSPRTRAGGVIRARASGKIPTTSVRRPISRLNRS